MKLWLNRLPRINKTRSESKVSEKDQDEKTKGEVIVETWTLLCVTWETLDSYWTEMWYNITYNLKKAFRLSCCEVNRKGKEWKQEQLGTIIKHNSLHKNGIKVSGSCRASKS